LQSHPNRIARSTYFRSRRPDKGDNGSRERLHRALNKRKCDQRCGLGARASSPHVSDSNTPYCPFTAPLLQAARGGSSIITCTSTAPPQSWPVLASSDKGVSALYFISKRHGAGGVRAGGPRTQGDRLLSMTAATLFLCADIYAKIRAQFYSKVWQKCYEIGQIGDMFGLMGYPDR
jgi:hypothetical protein